MKNKKKIFEIIFVVVNIIIFIYAAYMLYNSYQDKVEIEEDKDFIETTILVEEDKIDFKELQKYNESITHFIYIDGTEIKYPILQAIDNEYYLNVDFKGDYSPMGSLFLDYSLNSDLSDSVNIIYGHSSYDFKYMFSDLNKFKSQDYYNSHKEIKIYSEDKYEVYEVFSLATVDITNYDYKYGNLNDNEVNDYLGYIKTKSNYYNSFEYTGQQILTLYTCDLEYDIDSNRRILVNAYLKETVNY